MFTFKKFALLDKSSLSGKKQTENERKSKAKRSRLAKLARGFALLLAGLVAIIGVGYLWAATSTDSSLLARGIMWGDSDAGD